MPKLTKTGYELGSSEAGAVVLHRTSFNTRHEILQRHKLARAGVEQIDDNRFAAARLRGNMLEDGVAKWAAHDIEDKTGEPCEIYEPTEAYQKAHLGIASSIDRIITLGAPIDMVAVDGAPVTLKGKGILEIKTDAYHEGKPKPEWMVQVMHQMLCSDYKWGIIACLNQKLKLHLYPVKFDQVLADNMIYAYAEFWELVNTDKDYPPIAENQESPTDLTELVDSHTDVSLACAAYLNAKSQVREHQAEADNCKEVLKEVLDQFELSYASVPGFELKLKKSWRERKEQRGTGEFYELDTLTVKDIEDE
tara:strand:- start:312 stop:1232 length:921 start_codon:yes stop_codon:yes gene_type:complete